jgi:hypothetical protein
MDAYLNKEYIRGFESGCDFIVHEVERYAKQNNIFLGDLLAHLKGKNTNYPIEDKRNDPKPHQNSSGRAQLPL